ncbi:MAG: V-type ATP synthase subunit F [Armatimonadetes bacterium]|nr:V-type ATP synthase subunit F [Armatimonadota bacterium]
MAVVTDAETATGFRLAGVEVREAATPAEALEHLRQLIAADYGLAAVNQALLEGIGDDLSRAMRGRETPIVVPFPAPSVEIESGEDYIARLVKEHLGFYVKLR